MALERTARAYDVMWAKLLEALSNYRKEVRSRLHNIDGTGIDEFALHAAVAKGMNLAFDDLIALVKEIETREADGSLTAADEEEDAQHAPNRRRSRRNQARSKGSQGARIEGDS